jgi:hypothetical protein
MRSNGRDSASSQDHRSTSDMTTYTTTPTLGTRALRSRLTWRTLVLVGAPLAWIPVAFLHPAANPDSVYEDLAAAADRWLFVHLAQLVLTLLIGVALWMAVAGRRGLTATITRVAVPVYLVSFAAFDSVAGIATGLAIRHAQSLPAAQVDGVASTTEYLALNYFTGDFSPLAFISGISLSAGVVGVAMTLRSVGASRVVWISAFGGVLLNLHAAGVIPAVGLAAFAGALYIADRKGHVLHVACS